MNDDKNVIHLHSNKPILNEEQTKDMMRKAKYGYYIVGYD